MQLRSRGAKAGMNFEAENSAIVTGLPIDRSELEKLARWIPAKEMALLYEIFDRARSDPDLTRPALLLCSAYAERVARMLDQDPLPTDQGPIRGAPRKTWALSPTKRSEASPIRQSPDQFRQRRSRLSGGNPRAEMGTVVPGSPMTI
jgi:hypothetical protein